MVSDPKDRSVRRAAFWDSPQSGTVPPSKQPRKGETPEEGVSHEGDGEVGRDFYRLPPIPSRHPSEGSCVQKGRLSRPFCCATPCLRDRWVGVRAAVDVRVPEVRVALLLRRRSGPG